MSKNTFTVENGKTCLNGKPFLAKGIRFSSALFSEESCGDLINRLPEYKSYGINSFSVFIMGNRFTDIAGYSEDAALDTVYAERMERLLTAADHLDMAVVVGCLYWGESKAKYASWTQADAEKAVFNTARWLSERDFRHVFIDPDNEGMAYVQAGFDTAALIDAGHRADPSIMIASNTTGLLPDAVDLSIHHCHRDPGLPYIETEGTPHKTPGGYWERYSRKKSTNNIYENDPDFWNYINIGIYSEEMKRDQIRETEAHLKRGDGYFLASTWFQAPPPDGPNHGPGGFGTSDNPGILWWLEWLKESGY